MPGPFYIRDAAASSRDAQFIIDAFDSTIPHLTAAGSAAQWGTELFSKKPSFGQAIRDAVAQSENFRDTGHGERVRTFVAEVEDDATGNGTLDDGLARRVDELGKTYVSVGAVKLRDDHFATHMLSPKNLTPHVTAAMETGNFVFLDVLVADHRVDERRKGVGAALVNEVKKYATDHGKATIWIDCWAGGTGRLVQYYEDLGFEPVEDFELPTRNNAMWQGKVFRMDLV
ncbi:hypothetical protein EDB81DRAFT_146264 [Dactylonectria macrodidyma]|uniref:N-acetyltransferase domain-containing protein n=1 Tax=Dactylonectria macrodidyma TaxID=307937 RepID=A0A9P9DYR5_9HYPO|nr:hypothetical protein EDB81DRAFT_146264 [Dactylonectria macrodidyma]